MTVQLFVQAHLEIHIVRLTRMSSSSRDLCIVKERLLCVLFGALRSHLSFSRAALMVTPSRVQVFSAPRMLTSAHAMCHSSKRSPAFGQLERFLIRRRCGLIEDEIRRTDIKYELSLSLACRSTKTSAMPAGFSIYPHKAIVKSPSERSMDMTKFS